LVNQELLLQNEYLAVENRILKARLRPGWRLTWRTGHTSEIGKRLGRKALLPVARIAKTDTILAWYRKLVAEKFNGSKQRRSPGRQRTKNSTASRTISNLLADQVQHGSFAFAARSLRSPQFDRDKALVDTGHSEPSAI
jgi:hypothetical protein